MQNRVVAALQQFENLGGFSDANLCAIVPNCYEPDDESWWQEKLADALLRIISHATMRSEPIPPISEAARDVHVENFYSPSSVNNIRHSNADEVCIIRVYLGRRRFWLTLTRPSRYHCSLYKSSPCILTRWRIISALAMNTWNSIPR